MLSLSISSTALQIKPSGAMKSKSLIYKEEEKTRKRWEKVQKGGKGRKREQTMEKGWKKVENVGKGGKRWEKVEKRWETVGKGEKGGKRWKNVEKVGKVEQM